MVNTNGNASIDNSPIALPGGAVLRLVDASSSEACEASEPSGARQTAKSDLTTVRENDLHDDSPTPDPSATFDPPVANIDADASTGTSPNAVPGHTVGESSGKASESSEAWRTAKAGFMGVLRNVKEGLDDVPVPGVKAGLSLLVNALEARQVRLVSSNIMSTFLAITNYFRQTMAGNKSTLESIQKHFVKICSVLDQANGASQTTISPKLKADITEFKK